MNMTPMSDPISALHLPSSWANSQGIVPLQQRVESGTETASVAVAELNALYRALMEADAGVDAYDYLKSFVNVDGEKPFRTTGQQMEALKAVMARLKEEGQLNAPAYGLAQDAFGKAFSMNFMLQAFAMSAMRPSDDEDSAENMQW